MCRYTSDISIGPDILKLTFEQLRKIRNTGRFLLGNLHDFDPVQDSVPVEDMAALDRFVLHATASTLTEAAAAYDVHAFSKAYGAVNALVNQYLNGFFFEVAKDRLYLENVNDLSRRSAQTVQSYMMLDKRLASSTPHAISPYRLFVCTPPCCYSVTVHLDARNQTLIHHVALISTSSLWVPLASCQILHSLTHAPAHAHTHSFMTMVGFIPCSLHSSFG